LEALKWLHAQGCPLDGQVIAELAASCDLEGLRWAIDAGVPMDDEACSYAAYRGRRDVMELLKAHGCPWSDDCWETARKGHWDLLRWMRAQDPPAPWDAAEAERLATRHGQWDVADAARAELDALAASGDGGEG
jgi:hypothetical protein